jgi:hypothetical protein
MTTTMPLPYNQAAGSFEAAFMKRLHTSAIFTVTS